MFIGNKWYLDIGVLSVVKETKVIISKDGKSVIESYYVSNIINIKTIANVRREHWTIESYHWTLDNVFFEDRCIIKNVNATTVLDSLRKLALLLLSLPVIQQTNNKGEPIAKKNQLKAVAANLEKVLTTPL